MTGCNNGTTVQVDSRDSTKANIGPAGLSHTTEDLTRSSCSASRQVAEMVQGQRTRLIFFVVDANGVAVDLTNAASVKIIAKDTPTSDPAYLEKSASVVDAAKGKVLVNLVPDDTPDAGLFYLHVLVYNSSNQLLWNTPYWLAINPSLDALESSQQGVITLAEIRLIMRDECASQNLLLDDFEFNDSQIMAAIRLPVDKFNETNQPKTMYTARTFPWRYHWLRAAAGYLFEIAARGYARDHLPYGAGGVSVDDKNKAGVYLQLAKDLLAEWDNFVVQQKIQLNVEGAWGTLRSAYTFWGH